MNRNRLDLALFKFALFISFALIVIGGIFIGRSYGTMVGGYAHGATWAMYGFMFGIIAGILATGFGLTLLSINDHLQAIRVTLGGNPPEAPARVPEARLHWLDASNTPKGPVTLNDLRTMLERGEIAPDTRVAKSGDKAWTPLHTLLGIQEGKA